MKTLKYWPCALALFTWQTTATRAAAQATAGGPLRVEQIALSPTAKPGPGQALTANVTFRNTGKTPSPPTSASLIACDSRPYPFRDKASGPWSINQALSNCTHGAGAQFSIPVPGLAPGATAVVPTQQLPERNACLSVIAVKHGAGADLNNPAVAGTAPIYRPHLAGDPLKRRLIVDSMKLEVVYKKVGKQKVETTERIFTASVRLMRDGKFNVQNDRVTVAQCRGEVCFLKHSEPVASKDFTRTPGKNAVDVAHKTFTAKLSKDSNFYYAAGHGMPASPSSVRVAYEDVRREDNFIVPFPCEDLQRVASKPLK